MLEVQKSTMLMVVANLQRSRLKMHGSPLPFGESGHAGLDSVDYLGFHSNELRCLGKTAIHTQQCISAFWIWHLDQDSELIELNSKRLAQGHGMRAWRHACSGEAGLSFNFDVPFLCNHCCSASLSDSFKPFYFEFHASQP
jgi:hypothetical protein